MFKEIAEKKSTVTAAFESSMLIQCAATFFFIGERQVTIFRGCHHLDPGR
jgi:hypothetical protein